MITEARSKPGTAAQEQGLPEVVQQTEPSPAPEIRIGKGLAELETAGTKTAAEVFTMTLGQETIPLLPLKTWSQLDVFKWRVRGILAGTPAGLEITPEHVKMAGETVSTQDPEGCEKLERAFNQWLALERQAVQAAKQQAQTAAPQECSSSPEDEPLGYEVHLDKMGQPHIRCFEGKETIADVAVTVPGLGSLITQGLMRKPANWKIGALRDWLELDGQVFKFKDGGGNISELEKILNERYRPTAEGGSTQDVLVRANPASPSGFDIQFPAAANGLAENKPRHLDVEAMELLSDPRRCHVLRKGILVKLLAPNLIFKQKTADGGERPLECCQENTVVLGEDGQQKVIDLSQPVSHLGLGASELTAIFNHPAINRRARMSMSSPG